MVIAVGKLVMAGELAKFFFIYYSGNYHNIRDPFTVHSETRTATL